MRTVTFKSILDRTFRRRGLDPTAVTATQNLLVADFVNERMRRYWQYAWWPEWTFLEERAYRPYYVSGATYSTGTEVFDGTSKYYSSVQDNNTSHALTDAAWWAEISATMIKYILLDQPGYTRIGTVKNMYATKVDAQEDKRDLTYYIDTDRIVVTDSRAGATVWVIVQKIVPTFTTEAWSSLTSYVEGYVVYYPSTQQTQLQGNCYRASKTSNNVEYWELMEIPAILESALVKGCVADYYNNDTQLERAAEINAEAQIELDEAYSTAISQAGLNTTIARIIVP